MPVSKTWRALVAWLRYWYFRYLMATEMYMVESWERLTMHCLFAVIFTGFWYINVGIVLSGISRLRFGWELTNKFIGIADG